ncbi:Lrp/AsnC family leucine-responsive transcriptional regulator [Bradyrhizobium sp. USDA 377]
MRSGPGRASIETSAPTPDILDGRPGSSLVSPAEGEIAAPTVYDVSQRAGLPTGVPRHMTAREIDRSTARRSSEESKMSGQAAQASASPTRSQSAGREAVMQLDKIDFRLLDLVQRDNRLCSEQLGGKVGLSASGVQRRLKRLRSTGVIEADVSIISPKAIGRNVTAVVLISLERARADTVDRLKRQIRNMPEVMSAFCVTGLADLVLLVTVNDMEDYERFARRLTDESSDIKRIETMVVMDRFKAGFTLPIASIAWC